MPQAPATPRLTELSVYEGLLTQEHLQNNSPSVSLPGCWEIRRLPYKVGRLRYTLAQTIPVVASLKTCHCLNNISKVIGHGDKQGSLLGISGTDFVDPAENEGTNTTLHTDWSDMGSFFCHQVGLTPMLANQSTIIRFVMLLYRGILRSPAWKAICIQFSDRLMKKWV